MSPRNKTQKLYHLVSIPVFLIILGAFALSAAAVVENLRFFRATNQILELVSTVRSQAAARKSFAQNPGEDIWDALVKIGQAMPLAAHPNPWGGNISAVAAANMGMRLENDLPTHDCPRMILYFLGRQPTELGLVAMEARPEKSAVWTPVYPASADDHAAETACGSGERAELALTFKIR